MLAGTQYSQPSAAPLSPQRNHGRATQEGAFKSAGKDAASQPARSAKEKEHEELRRNMLRSIITEPLLSRIQEQPRAKFDVIISLNELYQGGLESALEQVQRRAVDWGVKYSSVSSYVFARLTAAQIQKLARETQDLVAENRRAETVVYRIWEDSDIAVTLTRSLTTVKADAAQRAFHALGEGIVWAVLDSGVDGRHAHFAEKQTLHGRIDSLGVRTPIEHRDYTPDGDAQNPTPGDATLRDNATQRTGHASALVDRLDMARTSPASSVGTGPPRRRVVFVWWAPKCGMRTAVPAAPASR